MTTSEIIDLADYRRERERRRREAFALYGADGERSRLVLQLWRAVSALDGDRAAALWIDEYGPGLAHVYCVLDLAADPARRDFTPEPLKRAWQGGVPGFLDVPDAERAPELAVPGGIRSLAAVSLGSDGVKAWFLTVDSRTPRPPLSESARSELMFSAGEAAGLLLHRDLGELAPSGNRSGGAPVGVETGTFAGWRVLQDIDGREEDEDANERITRRFLVVRLVRWLVDDGFVVDGDTLADRVEAVREELADAPESDAEARMWRSVVEAVEREDSGDVAAATLDLGGHVEAGGHYHGAAEIYQIAYEACTAAGAKALAVDAARLQGRAFRKLAAWDDSEEWYGRAEEMAEALGDDARRAIVMSGRANVLREKGNLPDAEELLVSGLEIARAVEADYASGLIHHGLSAVRKEMDRTETAIVDAWAAIQAYPESDQKASALLDLAGIFLERGQLEAAEDAYHIALLEPEEEYYRVMALSGLAFAGAVLEGPEEYERRRRVLDETGWREAGAPLKAQVLYEQGRAANALRNVEEAQELLKESLLLAEENDLNKLLFEVEDALARSGEVADVTESPPAEREFSESVAEVVHGLRTRRRALADAI